MIDTHKTDVLKRSFYACLYFLLFDKPEGVAATITTDHC